VEAAKTLKDRLTLDRAAYDLTLHGPNGFVRRFRGGAGDPLEVRQGQGGDPDTLDLVLLNPSNRPVTVRTANAYGGETARIHHLQPGANITDSWSIAPSGHWYDLTVTVDDDRAFLRGLAGHVETGRPSRSDPALDWTTA
jgi:phospholipase C